MCEFCSNQYHLGNAKWGEGEYGTPGGTVTWSFAQSAGSRFDFSEYITEPEYRALIREAFQAWEDVIDIDFVEVADSAATNVRLGWDDMDGPFNVVGEASSRGSKTVETLFELSTSEIRFDTAENWATDKTPARDEIGLYQVALHEIGHVLGLDHTTDPNTIMYSSDISGLDGLTAGDITGAQLFYGASASFGAEPEPAPAPAPTPAPTPAPSPSPSPNSTYTGTGNNDSFIANSGDDVINGRGGVDTLSLSGDQTQYTLTMSRDGMVLTDRAGRDGSDLLIDIEQLDFQSGASSSGGTYFNIEAFDGIVNLSEEAFSQIVELYIAYFNRAPDAVGLAFWGNAFADGLSMERMAELFIDQEETRDLYPDDM
ncbi:MAG: matrixin family metalloprotease, partial [Pseudomonadota bacterium]